MYWIASITDWTTTIPMVKNSMKRLFRHFFFQEGYDRNVIRKGIQRALDAVFGLYTIQNPWRNHDVKTKTPEPPVDTTVYAKVVFHHYREGYVFERSRWRFIDITFPREKDVAVILKNCSKMTCPDIDDLFIHMRTNVEFIVPVDKLSDLKVLTDYGFTVLPEESKCPRCHSVYHPPSE